MERAAHPGTLHTRTADPSLGGAGPPLRRRLFLVGAAKSGTSSLYDWLSRHPGIFAPAVKEPRYFAFAEGLPDWQGPRAQSLKREVVRERAAYDALYAPARPDQVTVDGSAVYLSSETAAAAIARAAPEAHIVAVLRQPADRAFSQWLHLRREGVEPLDFAQALAAEEERRATGWPYLYGYIERGRYASQLERYLRQFPARQVQVEWFDDLVRSPEAVTGRILQAVGLPPAPSLDPVRRNEGYVPRSVLLDRWLGEGSPVKPWLRRFVPRRIGARLSLWLDRRNRAPTPAFDPQLRSELTARFEAEIRALEAITGRDLQGWRQARPAAAGPVSASVRRPESA